MSDPWIERFKREALPLIVERFRPEKVLFFGSRARGEARSDSDLDVIIVAESFRGVPFVRRMAMVLRLARFPKHVDYLCYTGDEFERVKGASAVLQDALEHCVAAPV